MILIVGGLLIMMGQHDRSEALFYYFRLEDQVPESHLLRLIDQHISFEFVRQRLKDSYSETGRPSIDPELLLRILLIGYLYGITSERKLVEELRMHLAWRWFTGLGFDQEIPHHSTFSKNRHGRFLESKLFEQLFEQIVRQCVEVGLVQGKHLSVSREQAISQACAFPSPFCVSMSATAILQHSRMTLRCIWEKLEGFLHQTESRPAPICRKARRSVARGR
ncbi:MAG TPA: transposase [Candidatus Sulfotelmatobacter sp.]|nr:transposase [Candidatus Sulfotelmatobacter sp.]